MVRQPLMYPGPMLNLDRLGSEVLELSLRLLSALCCRKQAVDTAGLGDDNAITNGRTVAIHDPFPKKDYLWVCTKYMATAMAGIIDKQQ